jgi:hypothetical protein
MGAIRRGIIIRVVGNKPDEQDSQQALPPTWNDPLRIAFHRRLTPSDRIRLTIEASRAALSFARGRRVDER